MTTTTAVDHRIHMTFEDALRITERLTSINPERVASPEYFDDRGQPVCIVAHVLHTAGFQAPPAWWEDFRHSRDGQPYLSSSIRRNTHIMFLASEIFSNEDVFRDAFLRTLQTRQDHAGVKNREWAKVLKATKAYVSRLPNSPLKK